MTMLEEMFYRAAVKYFGKGERRRFLEIEDSVAPGAAVLVPEHKIAAVRRLPGTEGCEVLLDNGTTLLPKQTYEEMKKLLQGG